VSLKEKRMIEAMRSLGDEERKLLEATLTASGQDLRLAIFALGRADLLDQHDADEKQLFQHLLSSRL
jgi:hypothetical protein